MQQCRTSVMKYAMSPAGRLSMSGVIRCRNCPLEQHLDRIALSLFSSGDRMATLVHLPSPLAPSKMISLRQIFTLGWPSLSLFNIPLDSFLNKKEKQQQKKIQNRRLQNSSLWKNDKFCLDFHYCSTKITAIVIFSILNENPFSTFF